MKQDIIGIFENGTPDRKYMSTIYHKITKLEEKEGGLPYETKIKDENVWVRCTMCNRCKAGRGT